jgi:hypothetical protein
MALLRRSPATLVYVAVLAATTAVLQFSSSHTAARLLQAQSTNLYHLAREPIRVLITSAFWLSSSWEVLAWAPLFLLVVAPIEARLGSRRTIVVFAAGHIGASLLTAAGLWVALRVDAVEHSIEHARDVGASYGFFAVAAAGAALMGRRAQPYAVVAVCAYPLLMLALSHGFTDVGHVLALAIGFGCARLLGLVRHEVDEELAVERLGDAQQRVDARRPAAARPAGAG